MDGLGLNFLKIRNNCTRFVIPLTRNKLHKEIAACGKSVDMVNLQEWRYGKFILNAACDHQLHMELTLHAMS